MWLGNNIEVTAFTTNVSFNKEKYSDGQKMVNLFFYFEKKF